ncbi:hypothetical protein D3C81_1701960 [compost metagenome]
MHTRVGQQNIQRTEGIDGRREQTLNLVFLGDISANGDGLPTVSNDLPGQCFGRFCLTVVVDDHCRAGSGQGFGARVADAGAGAGDQGCLSGEGNMHAKSRLE